jgi:ligand-binding sensor domain-containing protein
MMDKGLALFDEDKNSLMTFVHQPDNPDSLSSNQIRSMFEDSTGQLWVGTYGGGLNRYNRATDKFEHFKHNPNNPHSLASDKVWTLLKDHLGRLWVGTTDGLARHKGAGNVFKTYLHETGNPESLPANSINDIFEDSQGRLWIATVAGLAQYNRQNDNFEQPSDVQELTGSSILGVTQDNSGTLRLSGNKGLYAYQPEKNTLNHYTVKDGLSGDGIHNGALRFGKSGRVYVGTHRGFTEFLPKQIKSKMSHSPVRLTNFSILNVPQKVGSSHLPNDIAFVKKLQLSHQDYLFGFEFSTLNYRQSKKTLRL